MPPRVWLRRIVFHPDRFETESPVYEPNWRLSLVAGQLEMLSGQPVHVKAEAAAGVSDLVRNRVFQALFDDSDAAPRHGPWPSPSTAKQVPFPINDTMARVLGAAMHELGRDRACEMLYEHNFCGLQAE